MSEEVFADGILGVGFGKGAVRIDGRFLGTITSDGKLILGKDAYVEGTISVGELEVHGTLQGEVSVSQRSLLHNTAKVSGSLCTALLAMEEGAILQGELRMGKDLKAAADLKAEHGLVRNDPHAGLMDAPVKQ